MDQKLKELTFELGMRTQSIEACTQQIHALTSRQVLNKPLKKGYKWVVAF